MAEEDYMSDKFLVVTEKNKKLLPQKRKFTDKPKPIKELEKVSIEQGINTPLDSTNKGFRMLARMGFKDGQGLGKGGTGIVEPLPLVFKEGRTGIAEKSKITEINNNKRPKMETRDLRQFNTSQSSKLREKKVIKIIISITTKTCPYLDESAGIEKNALLADWQKIEALQKQDKAQSQSFADYLKKETPERRLERLRELLLYLRERHLYCTFCAVTYKDEEDMKLNCPGMWDDDH
jgi:hypothetical protein